MNYVLVTNILLFSVFQFFCLNVFASNPRSVNQIAQQSIAIVQTFGLEGEKLSQGSAVLIGPGVLATNWHVVEGALSLEVSSGNVVSKANLFAADKERDLALLSADNFPGNPIKTSYGPFSVGDKVYALGAPMGLELSLSEGIISGLRDYKGGEAIQITASISPGSSGGALLDENGVLIGITTFAFRGGQNLNFALPVSWYAELILSASEGKQKRWLVNPPLIRETFFVTRANDTNITLVDPTKIKNHQGLTIYESVLRGAMNGVPGIEFTNRYALDCEKMIIASLSVVLRSYVKDISPRTLLDENLDSAAWDSVDFKQGKYDKDEIEAVCQFSKSKPSGMQKFKDNHFRFLPSVIKTFLRAEEMFDSRLDEHGELESFETKEIMQWIAQ